MSVGLAVDKSTILDSVGELLQLRMFYERYFAILEGQKFADWPKLFSENGCYTVQSASSRSGGYPICDIYCGSRAMISDRAAALASTSLFEARFIRYFLGTVVVVESRPEELTVEASYLAVESVVDEPPAIFSVGRSFDVISKSGDAWLFDKREIAYDHTAIRNSLIFPL